MSNLFLFLQTIPISTHLEVALFTTMYVKCEYIPTRATSWNLPDSNNVCCPSLHLLLLEFFLGYQACILFCKTGLTFFYRILNEQNTITTNFAHLFLWLVLHNITFAPNLFTYLWNIWDDFIDNAQRCQTWGVSHSSSDFVCDWMTLVDIEANPFSQNKVHDSRIRQPNHGLHDQIRPFFVCKKREIYIFFRFLEYLDLRKEPCNVILLEGK